MAKFLSITLCLAGVLVFAFPAIRALSSDAAEDNVLNYAAFENPQRPIAVFDHDGHNEKAELEDKCWFCHHNDGTNPSEDESSEGTPCADCHSVKPDDGTTPLMEAYHKQCITCHEEKGKGPVACGQCHVR